MPPIIPGTYRITSVASGTSIIVQNDWDAVCWEKRDDLSQQWYVQRSGEGYTIKSCLNGTYLAVWERVEGKKPATVFCGRYPTTWELSQGSKDHNMYMIKQANGGWLIDLKDYGASHNGNGMDTRPEDGWLACKRWRFERLRLAHASMRITQDCSQYPQSDATGDEEWRLAKEIESRDQQMRDYRAEIANRDSEIKSLEQQLALQSRGSTGIKEVLEKIKPDGYADQDHISGEDDRSLRQILTSLERSVSAMTTERESRMPNNLA